MGWGGRREPQTAPRPRAAEPRAVFGNGTWVKQQGCQLGQGRAWPMWKSQGDKWAPCGPGTAHIPSSCAENSCILGAGLAGLTHSTQTLTEGSAVCQGQGKSRAHLAVYRRGCKQAESAHTPPHLCCYKKQAGLWPRRPGTTPNSCLGRALGRGVGGRKGWGGKQSSFRGCCVRQGRGRALGALLRNFIKPQEMNKELLPACCKTCSTKPMQR